MIDLHPKATGAASHNRERECLDERYTELDVDRLARLVERDAGLRDSLAVELSRRGACDAKNRDARNVHAQLECEAAGDAEHAFGVLESHLRRGLLLERDAVVDIQLARRRAIGSRGDDDVEVGLAQCRRRHRARCAQGKNGAAANVDRDLCEWHVVEGDICTLAFDRSEGLEVVELVLRQVECHGRGVLLDDGRNEDRIAEEELRVDAPRVLVGRVLEPERVPGRRAVERLLMERRVEVVQKAITSDAD